MLGMGIRVTTLEDALPYTTLVSIRLCSTRLSDVILYCSALLNSIIYYIPSSLLKKYQQVFDFALEELLHLRALALLDLLQRVGDGARDVGLDRSRREALEGPGVGV